MIGGPTTTNNQYRIFRGIPASLVGAAGLVANDAAVTASRKDPWIRAASTGTSSPLVPAFIRVGAAIAFDFYLCSGNGEAVPNDCVELIFKSNDGTNGTTIAGVTASAGTVLLNQPIDTVPIASGGTLIQLGVNAIIQANSAGRVTGAVNVTTSGNNTLVIVKYRHIITSGTILVAAT
jgi:hypothetical protein